MALSPDRLGEKLRATARKGNSVHAVVESSELGYATVRLSNGGSRLTNLSTLGGYVEAGDKVYVDYRAGVAPTVRAIISETLIDNPCIYQAARAPNKSSWPPIDWPPIDWPPIDWPPIDWPPFTFPPIDFPPIDWPPFPGPDPEDENNIDIGIDVTRASLIYWQDIPCSYYYCAFWGQPWPNDQDITVIWRQADIWGGHDHPDECAWPVCRWDTFGNHDWRTLQGQNHITIPRSGVYLICATIAYWVILNAHAPEDTGYVDGWSTYYYHDKTHVVTEAWITRNHVPVARQTSPYLLTGWEGADQTNLLMTLVRCNAGDVIQMHCRHTWACWFTDVVGGMCQHMTYGYLGDDIHMRAQLIQGSQGAEE